ncbi:MAG TPA: cupin domain-containing protein [Beijerinckiaceae bacterium]|nr:cupin domain-containing protein [Beijerinckiaceae bacterium]
MNETSTNLSRRTVAIGAVLGALAASGQALAAECPADKRGTDVMGPGATKPKGVSDKLRGAIDLADEKVKLPGYKLRLRQLVIEPGGEVPWHSHAERPAIIYIVKGTITEYKSTCAVPLTHRAGDVAVEDRTVSHWWRNMGKEPCVLLSADLFHEKQDPHMM